MTFDLRYFVPFYVIQQFNCFITSKLEAVKILCICTSMCSDGHKPFTANRLVHVQLHTIEMIDATYSGLTPPQTQTPTSALPLPL